MEDSDGRDNWIGWMPEAIAIQLTIPGLFKDLPEERINLRSKSSRCRLKSSELKLKSSELKYCSFVKMLLDGTKLSLAPSLFLNFVFHFTVQTAQSLYQPLSSNLNGSIKIIESFLNQYHNSTLKNHPKTNPKTS